VKIGNMPPPKLRVRVQIETSVTVAIVIAGTKNYILYFFKDSLNTKYQI